MKKPVKMPALTDTMESGRLIRWVKSPGDRVERGDVVAEIETDKAITDLEVYDVGYLSGPFAEEDTEIAVGEPIAWVSDQPAQGPGHEGEAPSAGKVERSAGIAAEEAASGTGGQAAPAPGRGGAPERAATGGGQRRTPETSTPKAPSGGTTGAETAPGEAGPEAAAKAPAARAGASAVVSEAFAHRPAGGKHRTYDIGAVLASGPPYRITLVHGLRRIIAETMAATVDTPRFGVSSSIEVAPLQSIARERKLSVTALLAKALANTVAEHRDFNSAWTPGGLASRERVDVGVAMDTRYGLTTPVLRDAANRPVGELARMWRELKEKVEHHRAVPEEFRGATVYLSNLGMFPGITQFDAIVPPGAAAILAVASAEDGRALFTLNCDHRVVSGADAARFLVRLGTLLAAPQHWAGA